MGKTLYIPTSSLNFNCIVSSESISPAASYSQRRYGMKRFIDIFDGRYPDSIIASEQQLRFSRPPSDVEDHPMIIETLIEDNDMVPLGAGFYAISKTIYITPYTTRFLFFSEQDRLVAESLSEHSLEFKLSNLYLPRMVVVCPVENYSFEEITTIHHETRGVDISFEERVNRLKGMLYGYYLGALLSSDEVAVEKLQILLDVQNEFSAIISSGANNLNVDKEKRLRELSSHWRSLSPLYMELRDAGIDVPLLMDILAKYKVRLPINNLGISLYTKYLTRSFAEDAKNPATEWIEREIDSQRKSMRKNGKRLNPEDDAVITDGENVINIQIIDHQELVKHWFNNLLLDSSSIVLGEYSKMELADKMTDSAIEYLGASWKESPERAFLNKLRKHIGGESFDVVWGNDTLSSIAAVVLRGDEWDILLDFMQRKGMSDYRLAFAMYGALTGYANMTRDFVDLLYENTSPKYIQDVYEEFYGQLFGEDLLINLIKKQITTQSRIQPISPVQESNARDILDKTASERIVEDIKQKAVDVNNKYSLYYQTILNENLTTYYSIRGLSGSKRDGWKGWVDSVFKQSAKKAKQSQGVLNFMEENNPIFKYDRNAWEKIIDVIPDDGWRNTKRKTRSELIKEDLLWYQESQMSTGDNKKDIVRFCDKFKTQLDKNGKKQGLYYTQELRQAIKERLLSLYCRNE